MKRLLIACAIGAMFLAVTSSQSQGQWLVGPTSCFDAGPTVALAANNGWCVTRRQNGRVHVAYSHIPNGEYRHVYHRSTLNRGMTWTAPILVSRNDQYARDGVIASLWDTDTVAVAFCESLNPATGWPARMKYRQSPDAGQSWNSILELSKDRLADTWTHWTIRNPSLVCVRDNFPLQGVTPHAEVAWTDSCDDKYSVVDPGRWAFYSDVKMWLNDVWDDAVWLDKEHQGDYVSIDWNGIEGNSSPDIMYAFQALGGQSNPENSSIWVGYKEFSAGQPGGVQVTFPSSAHDSCPSIQVVEPDDPELDDVSLVAFQRVGSGGTSRLWAARTYGHSPSQPPPDVYELLGSWRPSAILRSPNLW